jgi:curved DNA-binding protein CbpA
MPNIHEKHYRILDLDIGASREDVKKSFRELSHIWHPDNHMGKPSNVQNRASEKFMEISNAYQVLKDYLCEEESRKKVEQDRRDREEKEQEYWKEQAKKKHEEEKSKHRKKEYIFVSCPYCKEKIIANSTVKLRVICKSCGHAYHYFFKNGELKVLGDSEEFILDLSDAGNREKNSSGFLPNAANKLVATLIILWILYAIFL